MKTNHLLLLAGAAAVYYFFYKKTALLPLGAKIPDAVLAAAKAKGWQLTGKIATGPSGKVAYEVIKPDGTKTWEG